MTRSLIQGLWLSVVGLLPPQQVASAAQTQFQRSDAAPAASVPALPLDYRDMVRLYAVGDHPGALALLGNWTEGRIRLEIKDLSEAVVTIRSCAGCTARLGFARFPLRAALLLHADREIQQQLHPPISEQAPQCGIGLQSQVIEHLAAILILVDPEAGAFLRPFYLGMARQAVWSHCSIESQQWARAGLKTYANDALLRLALGIASETAAFFTLPPAPRTSSMGVTAARQREMLNARIREFWEAAGKAFEDALAIDPELTEARLRLGRVQWRLGRLEAARLSLEATLAKGGDPSLRYLAHLFLGRVLEDQGTLTAAESHYREAWSLQPLSETPAVALSHAQFLRGDPEGARETLGQGLRATRLRVAHDPWVPYQVTQTNEGEAILAKLRRAVRP